MPTALDALTDLLGNPDGLKTDLSTSHDVLKLVGVVLAQHTLLDIATDPDADSKARVSAARALLTLKESPDQIAERLRRSPFAHLSAQELRDMLQEVREGKTSLDAVLTRLKGINIHTEDHRNAPSR